MSIGLPLGPLDIVDLTYPLRPGIPYWPGKGFTSFKYAHLSSLETAGVATGYVEMPDHTGTHVDAPCHFTPGGRDVAGIQPRELIAPGIAIDISDRAAADTAALLTAEDVHEWESANGSIQEGTIVLVNAGWGKRWGDPQAYLNRDAAGRMAFPGVAVSAAEVLAGNSAVAGIGVDTLSPDNGLVEGSPCHKILHGAGKLILENVANLDRLPARDFTLFMGVLPITDGTAAPCRLIALVPLRGQ